MRIAHLSDLHFGHHDPKLAGGLEADITAQNPDLVVISGDFTQFGTSREFREARAFLQTLPEPFFSVPGNHDIPSLNLIRRFVDPYGLYRQYIAEEIEPFVEMKGIAITGINTSRNTRPNLDWGDGSISRDQLTKTEQRFNAASPDAIRIVVAHHPFLMPQMPMQKRMARVKRADLAMATFAKLGVRLVLSGHFHLAYVRSYPEAPGDQPTQSAPPHKQMLVVQASTTISTRLRGHPNAYNLIDITAAGIAVAVREHQGGNWATRDTVLHSE